MSQSNEAQLDNPWNVSAPYSKRRHSNLSLDSDDHELAVSPSALGFGLWNLRSRWWHCLAGWLVATKEEKLKLHNQPFLTLSPKPSAEPFCGKVIAEPRVVSQHNC